MKNIIEHEDVFNLMKKLEQQENIVSQLITVVASTNKHIKEIKLKQQQLEQMLNNK